MSNKCFITKYLSAINNDSIKRLGEINMTVSAPSADSFFSIRTALNTEVSFSEPVDIKNGDTKVTSAVSDSSGLTVYVPKGTTTVVSIANKYNILGIVGQMLDGKEAASVKLNLADLKYSDNLQLVNLQGNGTSCTGDLSDLAGLTSLTALTLSGSSITGSLSDLAGLTSLTTLALTGSSITGSLSDLAGLTSLTALTLTGSSITGSLSDLAGLTSLTALTLIGKMSGDITSLAPMTKLYYLSIINDKLNTVTGSIEELVQKWRAGGRTTGKLSILWNLGGATFDGVKLTCTTGYGTISWDETTITASGTNNDKTVTA